MIIESIAVYNLIGEKLLEFKQVNVNKYTLNLGQISKGFYLVQINGSNYTAARKIMLK
jgi:hypothetical protein